MKPYRRETTNFGRLQSCVQCKLNVVYAMAFIFYEHAVQPSIAMCGLMMVGVLQFLETNSEYLHPFSMFPAFQVRKRCENRWCYGSYVERET